MGAVAEEVVYYIAFVVSVAWPGIQTMDVTLTAADALSQRCVVVCVCMALLVNR